MKISLLICCLATVVEVASCSAQILGTSVLSPPKSLLGYGVNAPPAPGGHPRICLTPSELPELRERVKTEPAKTAYAVCLQTARSLGPGGKFFASVESLENGKKPTEGDCEALSGALRDAALGALVSSDPAVSAPVKRALLAFVRGVPPDVKAMDSSRNAPGIGLAYDWMFATLSVPERAVVRQWLADVCTGTEAYLNDQTFGFAPGRELERNYNWVPFITGAFGIAALAIEGEKGYQARWFEKTAASETDFLNNGISDEGCPVESIHYFAYGMANGTYILDAMARRGKPVWSNSHLDKVPYYWTYDLFPFGPDFNSMQDTRDLHTGVGEIYHRLSLALPDNPQMQWAYQQWRANPNSDSLYPSSTVLWSTKPKDISISDLQLPSSRFFKRDGLVYARSSWDKDAAYLSFQSDPVAAGPSHAHADRNAFTFAALGKLWAMDGGGWAPQDTFHNLVFIDGKAEGYFPQRGRIVDFQDTSWGTAITGDAKLAYDWETNLANRLSNAEKNQWHKVADLDSKVYNPVEKAFRTAVLVRGKHPYALLSDDLRRDEVNHRYTWQMLTPVSNSGTVVDENRFVLSQLSQGTTVVPNAEIRDGSRKALNLSFDIRQPGSYRFWLFMGHETWEPWNWGARIALDRGAPELTFAVSGDNALPHWQPAFSKERDLSAGNHVLSLRTQGKMRFSSLLVAPASFDPEMLGAKPAKLPNNCTLLSFADLPKTLGWELDAADANAPQLLVQVISPNRPTWTFEKFERIRPDNKEDVGPTNRLQISTQSVEPKFRVLLLPYRQGEPLPKVNGDANQATLIWPDGTTDEWTFGAKISGKRRSDGQEQTLEIAASEPISTVLSTP